MCNIHQIRHLFATIVPRRRARSRGAETASENESEKTATAPERAEKGYSNNLKDGLYSLRGNIYSRLYGGLSCGGMTAGGRIVYSVAN